MAAWISCKKEGSIIHLKYLVWWVYLLFCEGSSCWGWLCLDRRKNEDFSFLFLFVLAFLFGWFIFAVWHRMLSRESLSVKGEELVLYFSSEWLLEAVVLDTVEANIKIINSPQSLISSCRSCFLKSLFLFFLLSLIYILEIALWCFLSLPLL